MTLEDKKTGNIDLQQINGLIEAAGIAGAKEIMVAFWRSTTTLLDSLDQHLAAADYKSIIEAAHALKGSAANVGASDISEFARAVEVGAREEDLEAAIDANDLLKDSVDAARIALDQHFEKSAAA